MNKKKPDHPIIVGKFGSCYGIRGWIRIISFTEFAENIFSYQPWYVNKANQWQVLNIESWKLHNRDLIVKLVGSDDRDIVAQWVNSEIIVDTSQLPVLEKGDYYWKDLIGCQVITIAGYDLGEVTELMETGSNDVLVVKAKLTDAFGKKERLIPFIEPQVIQRIDLTLKQINVNWDPGF